MESKTYWIACLFITTQCSVFLLYTFNSNNSKSERRSATALKRFSQVGTSSILSIVDSTSKPSISQNQVMLPLNLSARYEHYPKLPILIYTQQFYNDSITIKRKKIILIFTNMINDPKWMMQSIDEESNTNINQVMSQIHCPFLTNFCDITMDHQRFSEADAIMFHLYTNSVDKQKAELKRKQSQRFVFSLWEPPPHISDLKTYKNFFNWTFTYRWDSHIISTYFFQYSYIFKDSHYFKLLSTRSTIPNLKEFDMLNINMNRTLTAAALISNCAGTSKRLEYISKLQQHIDIQIYGKCGKPCPLNVDCRDYIANNYYFILSLENNYCQDYTSK